MVFVFDSCYSNNGLLNINFNVWKCFSVIEFSLKYFIIEYCGENCKD